MSLGREPGQEACREGRPLSHRDYLLGLEHYGIKLGLDNIRQLLEAAGNPHQALSCAHIAGTNGKGSVAALIDAMARAAGLRTGRFTSPHLLDLPERFLLNARPMPLAELDAQIAFFRPIAEAMDPPPTFFEMNTAIAFRWFAAQAVGLAVIEVGMGGRLDSTNVISPAATAITNIDLDHTRFLGDTLEQIAAEKAGIIKPRAPVVLGETKPGALAVLLDRARALNCPVRLLGRDFTFQVTGEPFAQLLSYESETLALGPTPLALAGRFQAENAAVAIALAEALQPVFPAIGADAIVQGLQTAQWPCRLEKVLDDPPVIIDVAHNPAGARRLAAEVRDCVTILAMSSDKDARTVVEILAPVSRLFILTRFQGSRAMPGERLREAAAGHPYILAPDLATALETGFELAGPKTPLLVTGSLFTAGEARRRLIDHYGAPPLRF